MTTDQLKEMFIAQEAWDRLEADKEMLARLAEAIETLSCEITKLNELLKQ